MHFWHKWKTVEKHKCIAGGIQFGRDVEKQVIAELQRCEKCNAERGLLHFLDGDTQVINADFITKAKEGRDK